MQIIGSLLGIAFVALIIWFYVELFDRIGQFFQNQKINKAINQHKTEQFHKEYRKKNR